MSETPAAPELAAWLELWRSRVGQPDPEAAAWADKVIDRYFGARTDRHSDTS